MADADSCLRRLVELGGGDVLFTPGQPPWVRVAGKLHPLDGESTAPKEAGESLLKLAPPERREAFKRTGQTSFAAEFGGMGRFRVHVFRDRLGTAAVVRFIRGEVPSFEKLGLPEAARDLPSRRSGLVLIVGTAGSGKTTTAAAMIDFINRERASHIATVEDPIEFIHGAARSLIYQREVGTHVESFSAAVRSGIRECADVILLSDVPDAETAEAVLGAANAGCLVLAETCACTAAEAIERLLGCFSAARRAYAKATLASSLKGILAQRLFPRADGKGCVAAFEVLASTPAVAAAIREGGARKVVSAVQAGERAGMKLLDDALLELVASGAVDGREAAARAANEEDFCKKCAGAGIALDAGSQATSSDESEAPGAPGPTAAPVVTRRLSRAEMFLDPAVAEHSARPSSRTAAFSESSPAERPCSPAGAGAVQDVADPRIVAGRRILVVDDDEAALEILTRALQGAGARVKAVSEEHQALAEIESGAYDLVMLDVLMPGMSGMELYDQALNIAPTLRERVLFVTGCNLDRQLNDRIAARGGRLLRKPFDVDDLLKAAAMALRRNGGGRR